MSDVPSLKVSERHAQKLRKYLQACGSLDLRYTVQKLSDGTVAIPVLPSCLPQLDLHGLQQTLTSRSPCEIIQIPVPKLSKKERGKSNNEKLEKILQDLLVSHGECWTEDLREDLACGFQRHGDLVLLENNCFSKPIWNKIGPALWPAVARGLSAKRLAQRGRISRDGFRTPVVTMLLGEDCWVTHVDNRIRYQFDVTKCMFSPGNITEKIRIASFDCYGETVVDLYAGDKGCQPNWFLSYCTLLQINGFFIISGIGYFTLPYLVHAGASHVHACEWNPDAVEALERNLRLNGVSHLCTIHHGDNRQLELCDLADRVNLGLIPSSQDGWPVACRLLKRRTGGVLHIHHNVTSSPHKTGGEGSFVASAEREPKTRDRKMWQTWADDTAIQISSLLQDITDEPWRTSVQHIEHVKSYAPHIHHIVLDLECRPLWFRQITVDTDSMLG